MANVEYFNKPIRDGYDKNCDCEDIYNDGKWSITNEWIIDDNGKRVPHTTVYCIYEDCDGDYPPCGTLKEAKSILKELKG